jgi:uncharacterized protein
MMLDGEMGRLLRKAVVQLIRFYQIVISPLKPPTCRFVPSCSQYAIEAVVRFGVIRGVWLAFKRIVKCGPWHQGGIDHVPLK